MTARADLPTNERLAIVEVETASVKEAVSEIKDAVVGIRAAVERMTALEERQATLQENNRRLDKAIEEERSLRAEQVRAETEARQALEREVTKSAYARGWIERLSVPVVSGLIGAVVAAWAGGLVG